MPQANPRRSWAAQRGRFYSELLRRWSYLAQNPRQTTFREVVGLIYTIYCAYHIVVTAGVLHELGWRRELDDVCYAFGTGAACLATYARIAWWELCLLAYRGFKWSPVAAVVVFFTEEAMGRLRRRKGDA